MIHKTFLSFVINNNNKLLSIITKVELVRKSFVQFGSVDELIPCE